MANNLDEAHPELTEENLRHYLISSTMPLTDKVPLENLSNLFKVPDNTQFAYAASGEKFERYKVKVDLLKWLIGTVGLTVITYIINWGFRDREQGMNEISQYDKYATELIVLNDNPVKKRMLAQFFARVTPSEKLKKGWQKYYDEVNKEFEVFMNDAIIERNKLAMLKKIESSRLSEAQKNEINFLEPKVKVNEALIYAPILVPEMASKLELASNYEAKAFSYLMSRDIENAIKFFSESENSFNGYNSVYDIAAYLKKNKDRLMNKNPLPWKAAYAYILSKYNWKMPEKINEKLKELAK